MDIDNLKAVIIDDEMINLSLFEAYATDLNLDVVSFEDSTKALQYLLENHVDIVYVDYMMPSINGIELIRELRKIHKTTPIIMITAFGDDYNIKIEALEAGATEFLTKPIDNIEFKLRTKTILALRKSQQFIRNKAVNLEEDIKLATQTILDREKETLDILANVSVYRDTETHKHIERVSILSKFLASKLGLSIEEQDTIEIGAKLHDIGKIGVTDSVLRKESALYEDEYIQMRDHTTIGYNILKDAKSNYLKQGAIISYSHHEKYDGSGYPQGLKEGEIPLYGRIVCLADVFDALVSPRYYKDAWSIDRVLEFVKKERGKSFDPQIVDILFENIDEFLDIYKK